MWDELAHFLFFIYLFFASFWFLTYSASRRPHLLRSRAVLLANKMKSQSHSKGVLALILKEISPTVDSRKRAAFKSCTQDHVLTPLRLGLAFWPFFKSCNSLWDTEKKKKIKIASCPSMDRFLVLWHLIIIIIHFFYLPRDCRSQYFDSFKILVRHPRQSRPVTFCPSASGSRQSHFVHDGLKRDCRGRRRQH